MYHIMALFNSKTQIEEANDVANASNKIGKGTTLKGDLESQGNVRIEGKIIGNIDCKSKVVMGESAVLDGNLFAKNAEIQGTVTGKVEISKLLLLKPKAKIKGDIFTHEFVVEAGAKFDGQCKMGNLSNSNGYHGDEFTKNTGKAPDE